MLNIQHKENTSEILWHYEEKKAELEQKTIRRIIEKRITEAGFDKEATFSAILSLGEAINNSIVHGFRNYGGEKNIKVQLKIIDNKIRLIIEDNGRGFDIKKYKFSEIEKEIENNPLAESGRGLFLIKNLVDKFEIQSTTGKKTKVIIEIYKKKK